MNYFNELNNINVNDHVEQKNGLSHLSGVRAMLIELHDIEEDEKNGNE